MSTVLHDMMFPWLPSQPDTQALYESLLYTYQNNTVEHCWEILRESKGLSFHEAYMFVCKKLLPEFKFPGSEQMDLLLQDFLATLELDLSVSLSIYFRQFVDTTQFTLRGIRDCIDTPEKFYDETVYARNVNGSIPRFFLDLFEVSHSTPKSPYRISTHYPVLFGAIIVGATIAPFSRKDKIRHSYKMNKKFYENSVNLILSGNQSQMVELEEYFIFERLFSLKSRLELSPLCFSRKGCNKGSDYFLNNDERILHTACRQSEFFTSVFARQKWFQSLNKDAVLKNPLYFQFSLTAERPLFILFQHMLCLYYSHHYNLDKDPGEAAKNILNELQSELPSAPALRTDLIDLKGTALYAAGDYQRYRWHSQLWDIWAGAKDVRSGAYLVTDVCCDDPRWNHWTPIEEKILIDLQQYNMNVVRVQQKLSYSNMI